MRLPRLGLQTFKLIVRWPPIRAITHSPSVSAATVNSFQQSALCAKLALYLCGFVLQAPSIVILPTQPCKQLNSMDGGVTVGWRKTWTCTSGLSLAVVVLSVCPCVGAFVHLRYGYYEGQGSMRCCDMHST